MLARSSIGPFRLDSYSNSLFQSRANPCQGKENHFCRNSCRLFVFLRDTDESSFAKNRSFPRHDRICGRATNSYECFLRLRDCLAASKRVFISGGETTYYRADHSIRLCRDNGIHFDLLARWTNSPAKANNPCVLR